MSIFLPISTSSSSLFDTKVIDQKWNTFLNDLVTSLNSKYSISINTTDFNSIINELLQSVYGLQNSSLEKSTPIKESKKNSTTICKGLTSKKTPCKLNAISNSDFCKRHSDQSKKVEETKVKEIKSKSTSKHTIKNKNSKDEDEDEDKNEDENEIEMKEKSSSSIKNKIIDIVKPKKEKASTKLIKATESISLPKREPFNFKTHKPVNIFDTKFWKIGPFLYDDDKDLLINNTTGLILEAINPTEVKLFGRSVEGELVLAKDCPEDVLNWAKKCSIIIETEDEAEDEAEDEDEDEDDEENEE